MGLAVKGNTFRLYTDFYNSDIIIASPLSLKQIEDKQGFDYLSSLEVLVVYGGDMMCMQNYDHLRCVLENCNLTIKKDRNTDISRLREYFMNDLQKYMRQSIFINCVLNSNLLALLHRHCFNPIVCLLLLSHIAGSFGDAPRLLWLRCRHHRIVEWLDSHAESAATTLPPPALRCDHAGERRAREVR